MFFLRTLYFREEKKHWQQCGDCCSRAKPPLKRFQVSLAFRSRLGILTNTSTPLAWTWEWKWDPRHLEQHENNFPCRDSRTHERHVCIPFCQIGIWMVDWLKNACIPSTHIFKTISSLPTSSCVDLALLCFAFFAWYCQIMNDLFDCFDDEWQLLCREVFVLITKVISTPYSNVKCMHMINDDD